jgi:glycosyltransferase involved in cell wall biosynthesis
MEKTGNPLVSIIIPTLNAEGMLKSCLDSIAKQTYRGIEVIGVDAKSKDNTADMIKQYGEVYQFEIQSGMAWGTPYQQNLGAQKAKGKYLYFVDADMVLPPDAIESYVRQMEAEGADSMVIPEISYGEGYWAQCKALERSCYLLGDPLIEAPRFHLKTVWDKLGGLDGKMGGYYDQDIHMRLLKSGYKVTRSDRAILHDEGRLTLRKLMKKRYTYGKSVKYYLRKYGRNTKIYTNQLTLFRPVYFRNWRQLIKDPVHLVGFGVMKTVEAAALFIGFLSGNPFSLHNSNEVLSKGEVT